MRDVDSMDVVGNAHRRRALLGKTEGEFEDEQKDEDNLRWMKW